MSEEARSLVEQMVAAGEWPEPALLEAIAAQGEPAVEPLLEVVRKEVHGWPEEAPLYHALGLLSVLKPPASAVPDLVQVFYRYDNETLESIPRVMRHYGTAVVEPLMPVIRHPTLHWYARAVACNIALEGSRPDPDLHARVRTTLRELLADYVARAETLQDNDISMASSLVVDLAWEADPEARGLIDAALAAELSEMMGEKDVEDCYKQGGRRVLPETEDWLHEYRRQYDEHIEWERRRAEPPPARPTEGKRKAPLFPPSAVGGRSAGSGHGQRGVPSIGPARAERKIGRNDPCWCGSGKKYKNCHLRKDNP
jgi:hypothetical protein